MPTVELRAGLLLIAMSMLPAPAPADTDVGRSRLSELLGAGDDRGFEKATGPRSFAFPEDHGPHPAFRNEWWYLTGNLDGAGGRRFGFELTFFRFALAPGAAPADSDWRSNQVYIAHLAITDADRDRFQVAERFSRGALGLAGARAEPFRVWIDDWEIAGADNRWRLRAAERDFGLDIELSAVKAPVLNGVDGLSQKSAEPGNASYYYSITRWRAAGRLRSGGDDFEVTGLAWLDREWSSSALSAEQQGWDWFALQFDDGSELMFYNLRRIDGSEDVHSAGTWVAADGRSEKIARDAVDIAVTDTWQSPEGGTYPAAWRITLPEKELELDVRPVIADQELFTTVRYWEGAVDVRGERASRPIRGRGYVELTGYAN